MTGKYTSELKLAKLQYFLHKPIRQQFSQKNSYPIQVKLMTTQYLRDHVLEGLHDLRALSLLEVGKAAGDDDDCWQHDTQIQLQQEEKNDKTFRFNADLFDWFHPYLKLHWKEWENRPVERHSQNESNKTSVRHLDFRGVQAYRSYFRQLRLL